MRLLIFVAIFLLMSPVIAKPVYTQQEVSCLAQNIYWEARGESYHGKLAVAKVTLNRVGAAGFPDTVCLVVFQHKQFSWTYGKRMKITDVVAWNDSKRIADGVLSGNIRIGNSFNATHFHRDSPYVKPKWNLRRLTKIGNHIFYTS